jgi:hypothetical protein
MFKMRDRMTNRENIIKILEGLYATVDICDCPYLAYSREPREYPTDWDDRRKENGMKDALIDDLEALIQQREREAVEGLLSFFYTLYKSSGNQEHIDKISRYRDLERLIEAYLKQKEEQNDKYSH